jgi:hypothetical protein
MTTLHPYTMKPPTYATIPRQFPNVGFRGFPLPDPLSIKHQSIPNVNEQSQYCSSSSLYRGAGLDTQPGCVILDYEPHR